MYVVGTRRGDSNECPQFYLGQTILMSTQNILSWQDDSNEYQNILSWQGDSNEYQQHLFLWRNMKNYP